MKTSTISDMTAGNPVKLMLQFMVPVCLGNIFQQLYNIADSMIAGQFIGVDALAAIGSTGSLMFMVTGWINGLSSGFSILASQCFGAGKYDRMRHYTAMSVLLMTGITVLMIIGLEIVNEPILKLMHSPDELLGDIKGYMGVIYAGLLVTAAYNFLACMLRALGDSRSPLYFLMVSAAVNVILDIVFIVCFNMGVIGCGYATVIAQGISAFLCFIYIIKRFPILHLKREDFAVSADSMKKLLALGIPMGLQFSITGIGTIIVQGAVNIYGAVYIAGFSAGIKIQNLVEAVFMSFGATIATYSGQNWGAGRADRVRQGVRRMQLMILAWSVAMMAVIYLFGKYLVLIFVDASQQEVIRIAQIFFRSVLWCYPFLGSILLYRNVLQGMGVGLVPMLGGVFELIARAAVVAAVAGRGTFAQVCLSSPAAWIAALIPLVPYYLYIMRNVEKRKGEGMGENKA